MTRINRQRATEKKQKLEPHTHTHTENGKQTESHANTHACGKELSVCVRVAHINQSLSLY